MHYSVLNLKVKKRVRGGGELKKQGKEGGIFYVLHCTLTKKGKINDTHFNSKHQELT